jgi:Flp pilus assembly protein TadD
VRAVHLLIALPGVVAMAALSANALRAGSADAIVYSASQEMGTWAAARARPGKETIAWVRSELEEALRAEPRDPTIHELLGVLESRSLENAEYQQDAVVHFRKALELRPTAPYTWANLAEVKYRIGDTGREFENALIRASQLGPSEREVQRTVADLGLAVWNEVGPRTQEAVDRTVGAGMRRNPLEMLKIAERRGRLEVACRHVNDIPRRTGSTWGQLCQSTEATP